MWNEIVTVTGWAFWIILGVIVLVEFFLHAIGDEIDGADSHGGCTAIFFITVVAIALFTDAFAGWSWTKALLGVVAYVVIGVVWAMFKWVLFIRKALRRARAVFSTMNAADRKPFPEYAKDHKPQAAENKSRIVSWMTVWPISLAWFLFTYPRKLFVWLYERLSTVFDRITDRIWSSS